MTVLSLSVLCFVLFLHAFSPFWGGIQKRGKEKLEQSTELESAVCFGRATGAGQAWCYVTCFVIRVSWSKVRMFVVRLIKIKVAQSIEV